MFDTKSIMFDTKFIMFDTKFIILNVNLYRVCIKKTPPMSLLCPWTCAFTIIFYYKIHHFLLQNPSLFTTKFIILYYKIHRFKCKIHHFKHKSLPSCSFAPTVRASRRCTFDIIIKPSVFNRKSSVFKRRPHHFSSFYFRSPNTAGTIASFTQNRTV